MPKINVYLPDDLATAVREAGIPVSPVCQKALAEAVRLVGRARKAVEHLRDPDFDPTLVPQLSTRIGSRMTPRLSEAVRLAREVSGTAGRLGTKHLLIGLLDEGDNLGVVLLRALDVDQEELRSAAQQVEPDEEGFTAPDEKGGRESDVGASLWRGFSFPARLAIAAALEASLDLGHNYLGCEHLLIGLLSVTDSGASRVLRSFGVDRADAQRAVTTAIAGFVHARQTSATSEAGKLDEISRRLDALERRLGPVAS